ncbi:MAG: hypothetical protein IJY29_02100, partial [Ruminococcus sp.]|nr:hypothetical protein [Ruminococcus sp.]
LENSEDGELEMINRLTPDLNDDQFERILEMSKRKRNAMRNTERNNIKMNSDDEEMVSGVEVYKRPRWIKPVTMAASFVLLGCGIAFGIHLMRNLKPTPPVIEQGVSTTSETTTTSVTTDEAVSTIIVSADKNQTTIVAGVPVEVTTTTVAVTEDATTINTETSIDEPDYKAVCEAWIRNKVRKRDEAFELIKHISDHVDMNDTLTVNVHDESGGPGDTPEISDYTVTYARYTNPKFSSLDEIRDFYIENYVRFLSPDWEYTELDMDGYYVKRYFDTRVQPGEKIEINSWNKEIIPLYTEYNGKIYKQVIEEAMITDAEYWAQGNHGILCCCAVGNCTEDSFELYELYSNDIECSWVIPCVKIDGEWRMQRDEEHMWQMSEDLWQELCEKLNNGSSDIIIN